MFMNTTETKISFVVIILNGMPFIPYHFRSVYTYAHEIIYVEGACPNASENATKDGHSNDGTIEEIRRLLKEEDPDNKATLITAEDFGLPSGFWPNEKIQMSKAGVQNITGNWLWILDSDEFYLQRDIEEIINKYLDSNKVDMISFPNIHFWGGIDYHFDGWRLKKMGVKGGDAPRIFKWQQGYKYSSHRPITILDESGNDLRTKTWIKSRHFLNKSIFMLHYCYLFPKQAEEKCKYYSRMGFGYEKMSQWYKSNYLHIKNPFNVDPAYMYPSWLERYTGDHPPQIIAMWNYLNTKPSVNIRNRIDIERLLNNRSYLIISRILKVMPIFMINIIEFIGIRLYRLTNLIASCVNPN